MVITQQPDVYHLKFKNIAKQLNACNCINAVINHNRSSLDQ